MSSVAAIPKNRRIAVFCQVGRGHLAVCILRQSGYNAVNLSGGFLTYLNYLDSARSLDIVGLEAKMNKENFCTGPTGSSGRAALRGLIE
ncbi:MAG: hypothetical protein PHV17_02585 [Candidatus Omnitrophica bacterium]|nr:hypothetical protein [Candidatus Omnitrophota bacterium]